MTRNRDMVPHWRNVAAEAMENRHTSESHLGVCLDDACDLIRSLEAKLASLQEDLALKEETIMVPVKDDRDPESFEGETQDLAVGDLPLPPEGTFMERSDSPDWLQNYSRESYG